MAGDTNGDKARIREFKEQLVKAARMQALCHGSAPGLLARASRVQALGHMVAEYAHSVRSSMSSRQGAHSPSA